MALRITVRKSEERLEEPYTDVKGAAHPVMRAETETVVEGELEDFAQMIAVVTEIEKLVKTLLGDETNVWDFFFKNVWPF